MTTLEALRRRRFDATQGRAYHPRLAKAKGASGVYAIWNKRTGALLYVGESHSGRLYDTITRHFRQWEEPNATYKRSQVQIAFAAVKEPEAVQARLIEQGEPRDNVECQGEDNTCARRSPRRNPADVELAVRPLGKVRRIEYERGADGKLYYHDFGKAIKLFATEGGDALVIAGRGLRVGKFIHG